MPCDVPRLLRQRFRGHGEDIGSDAIARWVGNGEDPEGIARSFGDAPRDARLWLSSWPFRHLVRGDVQAKLVRAAPIARDASPPSAPNPVLFARVAGALARVAALDALGFSMMVDSFNGQFDLAAWRVATGASDGANLERRLVALYRFATIFFDALAVIREPECRAALLSRRFTPGDPTEVQALGHVRDLLGKPNLRRSEFRGLYAQGVSSTFVVLRSDAALGRVFDVDVERGLLHALRVDEHADVDLTTATVKILGELAPHLSSGGSFGADDHVALDRLALLAAAALEAPDVAPIARHLFVCRDGRCASVLRWEVGGREAVRTALAGPMSEPPPNSIPIQSGPASPHVIYARDVLWMAFAQMAAADGKSIDELVDDAMTRYQALREAAMLAPPPVPSVTAPIPEPASKPAVAAPPSREPPAPGPEVGLRPPARAPMTTIPLDPSEPRIEEVAPPKAQDEEDTPRPFAELASRTFQGLGDAETLKAVTAARDGTDPMILVPSAADEAPGGDDRETPILPVNDEASALASAPPEPGRLVIPRALPVPGQRSPLPMIPAEAPPSAPTPPKGEAQSLVMTVPTHHKPSDFDPLPKIIINAEPSLPEEATSRAGEAREPAAAAAADGAPSIGEPKDDAQGTPRPGTART